MTSFTQATIRLPAKFWSFEGDLYSKATGFEKPFRVNYAQHHREINSVADLKATLRAGRFAWPGGYPLYFITDDGAALSFESALREFRSVADSIRHKHRDGWRIVGCQINYEEQDLVCAHSGKAIECAYPQNETEAA